MLIINVFSLFHQIIEEIEKEPDTIKFKHINLKDIDFLVTRSWADLRGTSITNPLKKLLSKIEDEIMETE